MPITVKKFTRIESLGTFAQCPPPAPPEFFNLNLIYGFNGTGKTTLSRVFASLGAGVLDSELPAACKFEVELSDGSTISHDRNLEKLRDTVLVYNSDFQDRNLYWKDGTARPVFIIGEQQAEAVRELEKVSEEKKVHQQKSGELRKRKELSDGQIELRNRDLAREIAEALGLGRKYMAPSLADDFGRHIGSGTQPVAMSDTDFKDAQSFVLQAAPLEKLEPIQFKNDNEDLIRECNDLLSQSIGEFVVPDLVGHEPMLSWVASGFEYHSKKGLDHCLLCTGEITKKRLEELASFLTSKFDAFSTRLKEAISKVELVSRKFNDLRFPSPNDVSSSIRSTYEEHISKLEKVTKQQAQHFEELALALKNKASDPGKKSELPSIFIDGGANNISLETDKELALANGLLISHNEDYDSFKDRKSEARERLKQHFLSRGFDAYMKMSAQREDAKKGEDEADQKVRALERQEAQLKVAVRTHGPAAEVITKLVRGYLGRSDIEIVPAELGFQLMRGGKQVKGSLSEGEKTAISICYFLSTLQAENRKTKNMIVVIDDPVSSLDTKSLNYSFNLIRARLGNAGQLFILTHNIHYMNAVKKWLRNRSVAELPSASLLFLDSHTLIAGVGGTRLVELPKHISAYDSEYHYLFNIVRRYLDDPASLSEVVYILPNALRKVLDIFFAFKMPGSSGLAGKIEAASKEYELDEAKMRALDSLVQLESHADDLEDLISMSSMTVEEINEAAKALVHLMQKIDEGHYKKLLKACR